MKIQRFILLWLSLLTVTNVSSQIDEDHNIWKVDPDARDEKLEFHQPPCLDIHWAMMSPLSSDLSLSHR